MADLKLGNIKPVGADNIVVEGKYVKGGYVVVANIEERNALKGTSGENIIEGSLCYCQADKKFYQYNGTDWEEKRYVEEHQSLEGYATEEYVDKAIEAIPEVDLTNYALKDDIRYAEEGLTNSIDTHTNNKNNPHEVTAEQIGLGNVLNVASYSKTENDELLKNYALKEELFSKSYNDLTDKPEIPDLTGYATEGYVDEEVKNELDKLAETIPSIEGLASEEFVADAIKNKVDDTTLENYYTKTEAGAEFMTQAEVDSRVNEIISKASNTDTIKDLTSLVDYLDSHGTEASEMAAAITELETNKADKTEIPDLAGYATEEFVTNKIDAIVFPETDLSNYYDKSEVDALIPDEVKLLDTDVTLSTELKTYYNVGKITNASGTNPVSIGKAGDTLRDVLNNLFSMDEIQPTITQNPSVSCSLSSTESDERGTDISQVSYSITFNDGAYTNSSNTGVKMTGYSFAEGNSSSSTSTSGILTFPETYTVGTSSKFSTTVTADYSQGNIAKTNLGNDSSPIVRIESGNIECTTTFSKIAVDYPYYVSSNASSILGLSSVTKVKKSTSLITSSGQSCNYSANAYIWIFIRKGTNTSQPTRTIQAYSDIAKEWGTFLGGTEKMGEITFNKENGKSDTFYAYRTTNVAQAADLATFRLQ